MISQDRKRMHVPLAAGLLARRPRASAKTLLHLVVSVMFLGSAVGADGITIQTHSVSIDLGGFSITGPVTCDNSLVCTPAGTGHGINGISWNQISVSNGTIRGMGAFGLTLGFSSVVREIRSTGNVQVGIGASIGSVIENSTAFRNGGSGISTSDGVVRGCASASNGSNGIAGSGSTIVNNTVSQNKGIGISGISSTIVDNTVIQSSQSGISAGNEAIVRGNSVRLSGTFGISASGNTLVIGNSVGHNTGYGLRLGGDVGFRENVLANNGGDVVRIFNGADVTDLGVNICDGDPCVIDNP